MKYVHKIATTLLTSSFLCAGLAHAQTAPGEMPFNMVPVDDSQDASAGATLPVVNPAPPVATPSSIPPLAGVKSDMNDTKQKMAQTASMSLPPLAQGGALNHPILPSGGKGVNIEDKEFRAALKSVEPLTDSMIKDFREVQQKGAEAMTQPIGPENRMISRSISLNLNAGETPPKIKLSAGMATALTFSGSTGAQWPILSVTPGNPNQYTAIETGEKGKGNMIVVSPLTPNGKSNLVVTLLGLPIPVIFNLETGHGDIDGRLDVSIKRRGPNDHIDLAQGSSLAPTNDSDVQGFVDGMPPKGSKKLISSDADLEAWRYNDMLYLRTHYAVLSPAYIGKASNVSGESVYTMNVNTPVVLVEQDGRIREVTLGR